VSAPVRRCTDLLAAIERYPDWYPEVVREAEVLERDPDGLPTRANASLHVARGPLVRDFHLALAVVVDRDSMIKLTRIPHGPRDHEQFEVTWRLRAAGDAQTRIDLALGANLSVPRLLPLGGVGDSIADGFMRAARKELGA
jgi:ribosome-associated toxin RatA of RatAB toxin-antitoxin module